MDKGKTNKDNEPKFDKKDKDKFWLKLIGKTANGNIDCTG